jgi:two-component system, OmpR family, sensor histidine kinase VicK
MPPDALSTAEPALIEHAPVLLWRSDLRGQRDFFNDTWLRFTGRSREEELGEGWMQGVHPEDSRWRAELFVEPLRRLAPFEVEYRLRRHDGAYRWVLERAVPLREENAVVGFVGAALDVQDRQRTEESREAVLRMMAHELRTPLQAVKMHVEVMRRAAAVGRICTPEMFDRLDAQFERFARLIGKLSQTEDRSGPSVRKAPLDLAKLLRSVVDRRADQLRDAPGRSRHRLTFRGPDRADVEGDGRRLEQAFHNVLDNALKFSPRGGAVDVELRAEHDHNRVTIRDEGVGIPADEIPMVSRRFFRASNVPRHNFPGLGLGLAMAREVFERHGGSVAVESEVDRGTAVTVLLPPSAPRERP